MAQMNRIPRGLTALLDIRQQGTTPREIAEFLQPTIDLLAFYALEKGLKENTVAGAIGAIGATLTIPVPASEAWLIYAASAEFTYNGATKNAGISIRLIDLPLRGGGAGDTVLARDTLNDGRSASGAGKKVAAYVPGVTTIIPGGAAIAARLDDFTGMFGTETMNLHVVYAQIGSFPGSTALFA